MPEPATWPQTWGDLAYTGCWIVIVRQPRPPGRKTDTFVVVPRATGHPIADIRWYPAWRTYALVPRPGTVWEATCLTELGRALGDLTAAYVQAREAARTTGSL